DPFRLGPPQDGSVPGNHLAERRGGKAHECSRQPDHHGEGRFRNRAGPLSESPTKALDSWGLHITATSAIDLPGRLAPSPGPAERDHPLPRGEGLGVRGWTLARAAPNSAYRRKA